MKGEQNQPITKKMQAKYDDNIVPKHKNEVIKEGYWEFLQKKKMEMVK